MVCVYNLYMGVCGIRHVFIGDAEAREKLDGQAIRQLSVALYTARSPCKGS